MKMEELLPSNVYLFTLRKVCSWLSQIRHLLHGYDVIIVCKGIPWHAKIHSGMKRCLKVWLFPLISITFSDFRYILRDTALSFSSLFHSNGGQSLMTKNHTL